MRDKPKRSLFDGYPDADELRETFLNAQPLEADEPDPDAPHNMECTCSKCDPVRAYRLGGKGALVND